MYCDSEVMTEGGALVSSTALCDMLDFYTIVNLLLYNILKKYSFKIKVLVYFSI